jgi:hypothetical protein
MVIILFKVKKDLKKNPIHVKIGMFKISKIKLSQGV